MLGTCNTPVLSSHAGSAHGASQNAAVALGILLLEDLECQSEGLMNKAHAAEFF